MGFLGQAARVSTRGESFESPTPIDNFIFGIKLFHRSFHTFQFAVDEFNNVRLIQGRNR